MTKETQLSGNSGELKNCPFCDSPAYADSYYDDIDQIYSFGCDNDDCIASKIYSYYSSSDDWFKAIEQWNTRHIDEKYTKLLEFVKSLAEIPYQLDDHKHELPLELRSWRAEAQLSLEEIGETWK